MQVLIVDDDDFVLTTLGATLARMGYTTVSAHDGNEALEVLRRDEIRLVVTDWDMPGMEGTELCRRIRRENVSGYVYIIMLTGREGAKQRIEGLCAGADDFLNKPLDPEELLVCLKTAERILSLETRDLALFAMAKLAESRDSETGAHVERVQSYARVIAQHLSTEMKAYYGVDEEYIRLLYQTSPLHDLGKVGIPDAVLLKPGKLTPEEFAIMKTHTTIGAQTLEAALRKFPSARFLQMARDIAATHHEKFDGSGYPEGLAGEQIPICGRIVAVADVYDAVTSKRVYKDAMSHEQAKAIIFRDRGKHFDPEVVDAFVRAEATILAIKSAMGDEHGNNTGAVPALAVPPSASTTPIAAPCGILVVEDDLVLLEKLRGLLAVTGEPVYFASSSEDALKIMAEHNPGVIIADWVMPGEDGVALCRKLHARGDSTPMHFIMLTAHSDKGRLLEAYDAGVADFIGKPFDTEELLARVRAGIRANKLHGELIRNANGSQALNAQLAMMNSRLERLSVTDELTGLFNRRHAMHRLDEAWALADRHGHALTIATIDIDHFKRINDTHGHDRGDAVLRQVADILRGQARGTDAVCRIGGEEFLMIFPMQAPQEAAVIGERCRAAVEGHRFVVNETTLQATISVGIAARTPDMPQFPDLLKRADECLYAAKHGGRNCVVVAQATAPLAEPRSTSGGDAAALRLNQPPIDRAMVLKRCGGDAAFAAAVTARFRAQAGEVVGRIQTALDAGNADELRRSAHSLKSMAAYMGADRASNLSQQIEELGRSATFATVTPLLADLRAEINRAIAWLAENEPAVIAKSA